MYIFIIAWLLRFNLYYADSHSCFRLFSVLLLVFFSFRARFAHLLHIKHIPHVSFIISTRALNWAPENGSVQVQRAQRNNIMCNKTHLSERWAQPLNSHLIFNLYSRNAIQRMKQKRSTKNKLIEWRENCCFFFENEKAIKHIYHSFGRA